MSRSDDKLIIEYSSARRPADKAGILHSIEQNFCGDVDNHVAHIWGKKKVEGGTVRYRCSGLYWRRNG